MHPITTIKLTQLALLLLFFTACSTTPEQRTHNLCPTCEHTAFHTPNFPPLKAYFKNSSSRSTRLHVYLEGDGITWVNFRYPAKNPNSKMLIALQLMTLDSHKSIYINRPCYGYAEMPSSCDTDNWTFGRYSSAVVASLNQAIDQALKRLKAQDIVLIGHSGGGTLAMLLAQQRQDVKAVITLAANLDHNAWSREMGYVPLHNSEDLQSYPHLPVEVQRFHYAAAKDKYVPAELVAAAAAQDPWAKFFLMENFDHHCCWQKIWPKVLRNLQTQPSPSE